MCHMQLAAAFTGLGVRESTHHAIWQNSLMQRNTTAGPRWLEAAPPYMSYTFACSALSCWQRLGNQLLQLLGIKARNGSWLLSAKSISASLAGLACQPLQAATASR
jgi:hypothetical protein